MVGHDDQSCLRSDARERFADDAVELDIEIVDHRRVRRIGGTIVRRMIAIPRPPHHVRYLIEASEVVEQQSIIEVVEYRPVLPHHLVSSDSCLPEKLIATKE